MQTPGRVFNREQLLTNVWGEDAYVDERTVDVLVGRLRKALNQGRGPDPIRTVRAAILILGLEGGGGGVWAIFGGLKGPGQGGRGDGLRRARVSRSSVQQENTR